MRSYVPAPEGWLSPWATRCWCERAVRRGLERRGGVAGIGLFGQGGGEPRPGTLQPLQADGGEVLAPFPELERFLQGEPSTFQPPDHLDELVARLLVRHLGGGRARTGLVAAGLVAAGLTTGVLATRGLPGDRLAAHGAAAALRLTRLGGHGANLAGPQAARRVRRPVSRYRELIFSESDHEPFPCGDVGGTAYHAPLAGLHDRVAAAEGGRGGQ